MLANSLSLLTHYNSMINVGIAGSLLNWFVNYLSSRSQFVAIGMVSPLLLDTLLPVYPRDPSLAHYCSSLPLMAFSIFPYPLTVT